MLYKFPQFLHLYRFIHFLAVPCDFVKPGTLSMLEGTEADVPHASYPVFSLDTLVTSLTDYGADWFRLLKVLAVPHLSGPQTRTQLPKHRKQKSKWSRLLLEITKTEREWKLKVFMPGFKFFKIWEIKQRAIGLHLALMLFEIGPFLCLPSSHEVDVESDEFFQDLFLLICEMGMLDSVQCLQHTVWNTEGFSSVSLK